CGRRTIPTPTASGRTLEKRSTGRCGTYRRRCAASSRATMRPRSTACHAPEPSRNREQFPQRGFGPTISQRLLTKLFALGVVHRSVAMQELLDVAAGGRRGVEKENSAGLAAAVLPRVRDVARQERARAGPADAHLVADLEGD